MKTLFEDLNVFEASQPEDVNKTVKIFDFDGTLFNSPVPNPNLWDKRTLGLLTKNFADGGYGWYQNTLTLDDRYVEESFNEEVVDDVKKSMDDPNSVTVLLTGRKDEYEGQIKKIVNKKGLVFDEFYLKPTDDTNPETTMNFKQRAIKELIEKYNPTKIEIWEDRFNHAKRFNDFLDSLKLNGGVHYIRIGDWYTDPELEKELVELLKKDPRVKKEEKKPNYWSAVLSPESSELILEKFKSEIPEGWKVYAHHMTIAFGYPKTDEVKSFLKENIGKDVELTVVGLGKSQQAMALRVEGIPSDNKIPHVTLATSPTGKPVNSNYISEWKKIDVPMTLKAKVSEIFN